MAIMLMFVAGIGVLFATMGTDYWKSFSKDPMKIIMTVILLFVMGLLWSVFMVRTYTPEWIDPAASKGTGKDNVYTKSLLSIMLVVVVGLVLTWIVQTTNDAESGQWTKLGANVLLVGILIMIVYKWVNVRNSEYNNKLNQYRDKWMTSIYKNKKDKSNNSTEDWNQHVGPTFLESPIGVFGLIAAVWAGYWCWRNTASWIFPEAAASTAVKSETGSSLPPTWSPAPTEVGSLSEGHTWLSVSTPLDTMQTLTTYSELVGTELATYQYAMSFWFFLDSNNVVQNQYLSILSYGDKPAIDYNPQKNTFRISISDAKQVSFASPHDPHKRILYSDTHIPLQKWNHVVLNYNAGTLDVFLNNQLVQSNPGMVPYLTLDALTIGQSNGLFGGITQLQYFRAPLSAPQIHTLFQQGA
jgi:hypothetical protein